MKIQKNVPLSEWTSFNTGGNAEVFAEVATPEDVEQVLREQPRPFWLLGSGANTLVSDKGLPGTTIRMELDAINFSYGVAEVEAGVNWDVFVEKSIEHGLWGVELMSGIPGSIGAAVVGNIAAYGQAVSDTLQWVDVIDYEQEKPTIDRIPADALELEYRGSCFSKSSKNTRIILRAGFLLQESQTTTLEYESALKVAEELGQDPDSLEGRRAIIMEARRRAGSLLDTTNTQKTAGSFFKNPLVTPEQAEHVMQFEERNVAKGAIRKQNMIHGGNAQRVSGAHVVLAAGFSRGQSWGPVRIHPEHALKIENTGGATSQQIYDVAHEIMHAAKEKLGIELVPEVRFMGDFS